MAEKHDVTDIEEVLELESQQSNKDVADEVNQKLSMGWVLLTVANVLRTEQGATAAVYVTGRPKGVDLEYVEEQKLLNARRETYLQSLQDSLRATPDS